MHALNWHCLWFYEFYFSSKFIWIFQLKKYPVWLWSETTEIEIVEFNTALSIVWKISLAHLSTVKLTEEFSGDNHQITTSVAFFSSSVLMPLDLALQNLLPPQCPIHV